MGIIIKQSIKGSIWSYLGLVVGYVNVGILMPMFFLTEQIGLVQLFIALSAIFTNFSTLGFGSVINRMFPIFRDKNNANHGFLFLLVSVGMIGFIISLVAFFIFKPHIIESNIEKSPLLIEYIVLLIPLFFFRILFRLLENYNKVLYDAVTGQFWGGFIHKIINLILTVLFALEILSFGYFIYGYIISLSMPLVPIIITLIKRNEFNLIPKIDFLTPKLIKEMLIVASFGLINGLSGTLTNNIDKLLINNYLSLKEVGIFSVCALFATVIMIPSRSTVNISVGIIAQSWKDKNLEQINRIYTKASLTQTIIGTLIFIGIIINLDNIFNILPSDYETGRSVLIYYSLGILFMTSSTNSATIISTSKFYKSLTIIIILQIVITVILHMLLIPIWGIKGAAISVLFTYLYRTIALVGFIKHKFGFFCYKIQHILVLLIAFISLFIAYILPTIENLFFNVLFKSLAVTIIYSGLILRFKISVDINNLFLKTVQKFKSFV